MKSFFSIGELSCYQNISRQTLIFYDKIGLFSPARVDPDNGYRYYSSAQLDTLDTILLLKKIGFSLKEIRSFMKDYTTDRSIAALGRQLQVLAERIEELKMIQNRVEHRCTQLEQSVAIRERGAEVAVEPIPRQFLLLQKVEPPHTLEEVSLATKLCFARAFREQLPIFFQSGAIVPLKNIIGGRCTAASHAFLPIEKKCPGQEILELAPGKGVCAYHIGDYLSIGQAYERILAYCDREGLQIISDSYEFAVNDYLSTGLEDEYITKIIFYVQDDK